MTVRRLAAAYLATGAALTTWWCRYDQQRLTVPYLLAGSALWPVGVTLYLTSPMLDTDDEETPMLNTLLDKITGGRARMTMARMHPGGGVIIIAAAGEEPQTIEIPDASQVGAVMVLSTEIAEKAREIAEQDGLDNPADAVRAAVLAYHGNGK